MFVATNQQCLDHVNEALTCVQDTPINLRWVKKTFCDRGKRAHSGLLCSTGGS